MTNREALEMTREQVEALRWRLANAASASGSDIHTSEIIALCDLAIRALASSLPEPTHRDWCASLMDGMACTCDAQGTSLPAEPAALPEWTENEAMRLLAFREAHCKDQHDEAWHHIYWLVSDRAADPFNPWAEVEALASAPKPDEEGR